MAHYAVYWQKGNEGRPLASHWYELNGVITYASPVLEDWVGKSHKELVGELWEGRASPWWDDNCVPPTMKYHLQLLRCVNALLIGLPYDPPTRRRHP
jgi:hypothetical protein